MPIVVACGAVILDADRRLLVVRRAHDPAKGRWSVPGGRVEDGESVVTALAREAREETGLEVSVGARVGTLTILDGRTRLVIHDHRCAVRSGEAVAGDDAADLRWVTRTELLALETTDGLLDFLEGRGVRLAP